MSFAQQVGNFNAGALRQAENIRRELCLRLFGAVIVDTPVLTGRLRGGWQTSTGQPSRQQIERIDTGGDTVLAEASNNLGNGLHADVSVFFVNNLPYARRIEFDGHSSVKAPAGMVRKNVARFDSLVRAAVQDGRIKI